MKDLNLLDRYIRACDYIDFEYGHMDCCLFVIAWIEQNTGTKVAEDLTSRYTDEQGANALIEEYGDLNKLAHDVLGESKPVLHTMPGDVVCMKLQGLWTMGISIGTHGAFLSEKGMLKTRLTVETRSWSVDGVV